MMLKSTLDKHLDVAGDTLDTTSDTPDTELDT